MSVAEHCLAPKACPTYGPLEGCDREEYSENWI